MKYALLALVLLAAFLLWRHKRRRRAREQEQARSAAATQAARRAREQALANPADMVRCRHCGMHLPLADATPGDLGHYCGHEHRQRAEG